MTKRGNGEGTIYFSENGLVNLLLEEKQMGN